MKACSKLGIQTLKQRRRNHKLFLLTQDEERHSTLSVAYDEITGDRQKVTTAAARRRMYVYMSMSHVYHGSCLPRTITVELTL